MAGGGFLRGLSRATAWVADTSGSLSQEDPPTFTPLDLHTVGPSHRRSLEPLTVIGWKQRESGGTGRRARLRIWYRKVSGFKSRLSHHSTRPRLRSGLAHWQARVR